MHPAILPAALAFSAASAMALYVGRRRDKTGFHWLLLAVLGSLQIWTLGLLFRFTALTEVQLTAAHRVTFLGVFFVPPFWLLLSARYARMRFLFERRGVYVALFVPSLLSYLALLTNETHGLVIEDVSFRALASGTRAWAGPVFWCILAWGYVCVLGGAFLLFSAARRMLAGDERMCGLLLALAAPIPCVMSLAYVFGLMPVTYDLTPSGLVASLGLISIATFRYQLFESLPLTRRDVIEHLRDGVVIANAQGLILDTNPAAQEILAHEGESLRGRPLAEIFEAFASGVTSGSLDEVRGLSELVRPVSLELRPEDGRTIAVSAASVRHGDGEPVGQFAVLRDRTEERRYERSAQRTQKLETVGTLAAGIAHEVNNPLAFIRANLSQVHRMGEAVEAVIDDPDAKIPAELRDLRVIAEETLDGIGRIERIVADMRLLSAASDDERVPVDVNEVVADALRLANLSRHSGIAVHTQLSDDLPHITGAPRRLVQALLNLLVNARQVLAGRDDARIEVATLLAGEQLEIRVRDNGPGIPDAVQQRIFDPFFTTKDPDQGTGLGLSISLDILRDHGGELDVDSLPGRGVTFRARIPVRWA